VNPGSQLSLRKTLLLPEGVEHRWLAPVEANDLKQSMGPTVVCPAQMMNPEIDLSDLRSVALHITPPGFAYLLLS
jgi:hypothetical protein